MKLSALGLVLLVSVGLSGCSGYILRKVEKDIAAQQNFRPRGIQGLWKITGHLESEILEDQPTGYQVVKRRTLHVQINGEEVLSGDLSKRAEGELNGDYGGLPVDALCSSETKTATWMEVRCVIVIDNERTVTLVM
jgi:hypothetical protein